MQTIYGLFGKSRANQQITASSVVTQDKDITSVIINPVEPLNELNGQLLGELFTQHPLVLFTAGCRYAVNKSNNNKAQPVKYSVLLTMPILRRPSKHSGNRFEVLTLKKDNIAETSVSFVLHILLTLSVRADGQVFNPMKHKRVVKVEKLIGNKRTAYLLPNEYQQTPQYMHAKKPVRAENGMFYMVMEFKPGKTFFDVLYAHTSLLASQVIATPVCFALTENALSALHSQVYLNGLVHRDIKPENIMVDGIIVTIIDFGFAKKLTENGQDVGGTSGYIAPERILGHGCSHKSDVYSLSKVLKWLWFDHEDLRYLRESTFADLPKSCWQPITATLDDMANYDPAKRLTALQALEKFSAIEVSYLKSVAEKKIRGTNGSYREDGTEWGCKIL